MDPSPSPSSRPRRALPLPAVQLVTGSWRDANDLRTRVQAAMRGGIRWVQLRAKDRSARELHEAACLLAPLLRAAGALFVVNDRVDVAMAIGADGVHLPEDGMTAQDARRMLGDTAWIACSVHSADAAGRACLDDLDAIQFGPVFDTASKREFGPPRGMTELALAAKAAGRAPLIAVGGVSPPRAASCREAGAAAVAVIGAVWDAEDVEAAAREFARG